MDLSVSGRLASSSARTIMGATHGMNLQVVLKKCEEGGFTALVPALPGCISEGDTREEALANIREAIELYLEPIEDDRDFGEDSEVLDIAV
jgi:predicted RNase H-like HicB family nuclease